MADIHPSPVPGMMSGSLPGPGPEFPHAQANALYDVPPLQFNQDGLREVLDPAKGGPLQESGYAHDVNAGAVAPYYPGQTSPIYVSPVDRPQANDDVSGTVAGAVAAAEARFMDYQQDMEPQGSSYGAPMDLPGMQDGALGAAYYDPPRSY